MDRKIILIGKSHSGKDTFATFLETNFGLKRAISCTTRPKRDYEVEGRDYNFITKDQFFEMVNSDQFQEYDNFNSWYYAVTKKEWESSEIHIKTYRGLKKLLEIVDRKELLIIYLEPSITVRKQRIEERNDTHDQIERRWMNDDIDFENLEQWNMPWDLKISMQDTDALHDLMEIILEKGKQKWLPPTPMINFDGVTITFKDRYEDDQLKSVGKWMIDWTSHWLKTRTDDQINKN